MAAGSAVTEENSPDSGRDELILILAPTGDDARLARDILQERGLESLIVPDAVVAAREIETGCSVVLMTSEALSGAGGAAALRDVFERQQTWSEMPIVLLGGDVEDVAARATELLGLRVQIILLERPLSILTFVMAIDAALRSRSRQYEVKRLLDVLSESAAEVGRAHDAATRAKDEFLATLGHELRSPITAIRGWIQMLKEGGLDAEQTDMALSMIDSSTKVQARIVEDLMDVSRIIAGKAMVEPAKIELAPVIENVVTTFHAEAVQQNVHLTAEVTPEPLFVWADEARLQQVGWNLVSNAIKFTPPGGTVEVSLAREQSSAVIRVRDTGEGISPDLLPHVFERYRQDGADITKRHRGLGLGLAIVRHLVEGHGGTIQAFSGGKGKGSEFTITLPLLSG